LILEFFNTLDIKQEKVKDGLVLRFSKKNGLFRKNTDFQVSTRYREQDAMLDKDTSALAQNLIGIKGFISQIQSAPQTSIKSINTLIDSFVSETAFLCSDNDSKELYEFVKKISKEYECVIFCQSDSLAGKGDYPHFLDEDLNLLLDIYGNSDTYPDNISKADTNQDEIIVYPDQNKRKNKNIEFISDLGLRTIEHLPCVESEQEVKIRSSEEIASRVVILAITNLVAFSNITGEQANEIISKYSLNKYVTPNEAEFLKTPTDDLKNEMSWRCEAIWTLCWALGIIDDLGSADTFADLNKINKDKYPITPGIDPNIFITKSHKIRSPKDILDNNDLYYLLNWACVDSRLNGTELTKVHPGVVYERQYALNWLIYYSEQEWDDITCDT
jgi:hypothetical protein